MINYSLEYSLLIKIIRNIDNADFQLTNDEKNTTNWSAFGDICKRQHVFPTVYLKIKDLLPNDISSHWEYIFNISKNKVDTIFDIMCKFKDISTSIEYSFLKGLPLSYLLYGDIYTRTSNDIDILTTESTCSKLHQILINNGFFHSCGKDNVWLYERNDEIQLLPNQILKDFDHHEYFAYAYPYSSEEHIDLEVGRYIHRNIKDESFIKQFISSTMDVSINNVSFKCLDYNFMFIYLCENIYTELNQLYGNAKLKEIVDLYIFINKYINQIDVDYIKDLLKKFNIIDVVSFALNITNIIYENKHLNYLINEFNSDPSISLDLDYLFERILDNDKKRMKIDEMLFSNYFKDYSKDNTIKSNCFSTDNLINVSNYLKFNDDKYNISWLYNFTHDEDYVYMSLIFEPIVYNNLDKFQIIPQFLFNDKPGPVFKEFILSLSESSSIVAFDRKEEFNLSPTILQEFKFDEYNGITIRINKENLMFFKIEENEHLLFNISIQEFVYKNKLVHIIGSTNNRLCDRKCFSINYLKLNQ